MNLLVTAGATREPLDAVRFLSNVSTGATGAALADALAARGCTVALLHGENAVARRAAPVRRDRLGYPHPPDRAEQNSAADHRSRRES